jgi:type II secretory pathway component GspD/PulD (secretin)
VADEGSNALIVRASPTDLTAIQGIVNQLDTEDKKDKTPYRVVQVKAGINVTDLAEQVETTINESAQAWSSGSRGARVQSVTVTPNVRTNSLVIAGYAPLFDQAEALAKKLEEMGPSGNVSTRIVKVGNIKVDQVQKLIDQLTQQPGGQGQRGGGGRSRPTTRPRSGP